MGQTVTDMKPEDVPDDLVRTAVLAAFSIPTDYARRHPGVVDALIETYGDQHRRALAAVLPVHQQKVTAKYRRFVKTVREITRHGESMQSAGSEGDQCVLSPRDLREALRDLRDGRQ